MIHGSFRPLAGWLVPITDDSGRIEEIAGQIQVVQLTDATEQLPSLLGWDVLGEFDISLNQRAGTVALRRL
jgi:hypothetical protein